MIATCAGMLSVIAASVRAMTIEEKAAIRADLDRQLEDNMAFMNISPEDWICADCGGRRKLFFNHGRSRFLRCGSCDLSEILDWIGAEGVTAWLDAQFLAECGIQNIDYDAEFLRQMGIKA